MSSSARPVLWRIEAEIEYWGAGVAVFDPEKVINRLLTEFPGSSVDPIDYSDAEVQRVEQFLSNSDATEKTRESMLRSVKGKEKRNGPTYWCNVHLDDVGVVRGWARRYSIGFEAGSALSSAARERLLSFLRALELGTVRVTESG